MSAENSVFLDICRAPKDSNLIVYSKVGGNGEYGEPQVSEFNCKTTALTVGKKDWAITNPETAAWLYSVSAALGPISKLIKNWVAVEEQSLVDLHFSEGGCTTCPLLWRKIMELGQGQPVAMLDVFSTDILSGRGKRIEVRRMREKYNAKKENALNN